MSFDLCITLLRDTSWVNTNHEADRQIDHVTAHRKLSELFQHGRSALQSLVALAVITAALLNPLQAAIRVRGFVGVVLIAAGVHWNEFRKTECAANAPTTTTEPAPKPSATTEPKKTTEPTKEATPAKPAATPSTAVFPTAVSPKYSSESAGRARSAERKMAKHFRKGLDDRMRDRSGEIRKKRSDTLVGTLREEYGHDFAKGYPPTAKLGTVLKKEGVETLDQLLRKGRTKTR